ncbi:hypothetical protein IHE44_0004885 [Lamprotornis superbus]|uniref:Nuclear pore complex protein NUP96 C-terminal domain-containing protein n=1 Tax=Lamprotornis superbus TaxID=245042 RepID=A0A835NF41_9PASS|nr:hypothetical protein IHE44_0004885 [Lamprotornis superbus]
MLIREQAVRELLGRHCALADSPESWAKETFLTQRLCIPPHWIHEAKAVRARMEGDKHKEALFLFKAGHWNQCHKLVVRHLASDAIINENYKYLKGFLEDLAPPERSALIQDWELAGLVYLDYIRVNEMLDRIQQVWELPSHAWGAHRVCMAALTAEGNSVLLFDRCSKQSMGHL